MAEDIKMKVVKQQNTDAWSHSSLDLRPLEDEGFDVMRLVGESGQVV